MEIEVSPPPVTSTGHILTIPLCLERFMCLRQRGIIVSRACIPHRILTDTRGRHLTMGGLCYTLYYCNSITWNIETWDYLYSKSAPMTMKTAREIMQKQQNRQQNKVKFLRIHNILII